MTSISLLPENVESVLQYEDRSHINPRCSEPATRVSPLRVSLDKDIRNQLARTTLEARNIAESAAKAALENLAVHEDKFRDHMSGDQRSLRNRLRARGRSVGDAPDRTNGTQEIPRLTELVAYENWHRLLFTRFLTENNLLTTDACGMR